jgi:hypothetical protein
MATSWWALRRLMKERIVVICDIFADTHLLNRSLLLIILTYCICVAYTLFTTALYAKILLNSQDLSSHCSLSLLILSYIYTFPYVASVVVFTVACLHVRDCVQQFADHQDAETFHQLRTRFTDVCAKLRILGHFFRLYLSVQHICGLAKLAACLLLWKEQLSDGHPNSEVAWINILLAARVMAIIVVVDFVGAQVSLSTRGILGHIVAWRTCSGATQQADRHEQLLLVQHSTVLEARNYHGLQVLSFDLTLENCMRGGYVLFAAVVYSIR